jgi:ABC-2 type transport system ATP-binding protein
MLEVKGLTKRYNSIAAVDDVSFRIDPGEVYGYLGPNASGKTTTVKMLTGLLEPTRGHIFYQGRDIREDLVAYRKHLDFIRACEGRRLALQMFSKRHIDATDIDPRPFTD